MTSTMSQNNTEHWIHNTENSPHRDGFVNMTKHVATYKQQQTMSENTFMIDGPTVHLSSHTSQCDVSN
jgi:hypothetical protein